MLARYHQPMKADVSSLRKPKRIGTMKLSKADQRLKDAGRLKLDEAYIDFPTGTDFAILRQAFLPLLLPTLLFIHLPFLALDTIAYLITGTWYGVTSSEGVLVLLVGGYALGAIFGYRRYREYKAYITVMRTTWRFNVNRLYEQFVERYGDSPDKDVQNELKRLGRIRRESLRAILLPTELELDMLEHICRNEANGKESMRQNAEYRRSRLSFENRELEHDAAKRIADKEQAEGANEYDALLEKYGKNIAPSMSALIGQGNDV